ncbi:MAG TPA: flagellar basal-body rod protein FlgF [Rhodospirillales bacterium]|nr:flagellar basal-body rod protein FlgF [Rhodospirillales bacterium]
MESSIIVALTRQDSLRRQLDVVANNLANMNSTAFKGERMLFAEHLVPIPSGGERRGDALVLVRDVATVRDAAAGELRETGGDLDVAIAGEGYLAVATPLGPRYTRDGHLRLNETGTLVTESGMPVMAQGAPVEIGVDEAQISISRDGTISSATRELGRLDVVRFARPQRLQAVEGGLLAAGDEAPERLAAPVVLQGMLEGSNVEPVVEISKLIDVQRAYEHASQLVEREDDRIRKALQTYAS